MVDQDIEMRHRNVEKVGRRYPIELLWVYGILG
jgi:hypothetical protein